MSTRTLVPRAFATVSLLFLLLAASAPAGTVTFDPPSLNIRSGDLASFVIAIADAELAVFDSVDVVVALAADASIVESRIQFEFHSDFEDVWFRQSRAPFCNNGQCGLFVGGFRPSPPFSAPLTVGTMLIDTTGMPLGSYNLVVDPRSEGEDGFGGLAYRGGTMELLAGAATLTIVHAPEPASLILLAVSAALICRPRHDATLAFARGRNKP